MARPAPGLPPAPPQRARHLGPDERLRRFPPGRIRSRHHDPPDCLGDAPEAVSWWFAREALAPVCAPAPCAAARHCVSRPISSITPCSTRARPPGLAEVACGRRPVGSSGAAWPVFDPGPRHRRSPWRLGCRHRRPGLCSRRAGRRQARGPVRVRAARRDGLRADCRAGRAGGAQARYVHRLWPSWRQTAAATRAVARRVGDRALDDVDAGIGPVGDQGRKPAAGFGLAKYISGGGAARPRDGCGPGGRAAAR